MTLSAKIFLCQLVEKYLPAGQEGLVRKKLHKTFHSYMQH